MQLPLETLVYQGLESNSAWPPDNAEAGSAEDTGSEFSDLLQTLAMDLPPESTAEPKLPLAGTLLPLTGNILPASDDLVPAADIEAGTAALRNNSSGGEPETVLTGPVAGFAVANVFTARPKPADLGVDAEMLEQIRNSVERSEPMRIAPDNSRKPTPVLPSVGAAQFAPPADSSRGWRSRANGRWLVGEVTEKLATRPSVLDEGPGQRGDQRATLPPAAALKLALSGPRSDSILQSRVPAAMMLDTMSQLGITTVPLGGASPAPSMPATAVAVTVNTPVLDPAWADAIHDRVLWLAGRNIQTAEIRLNPAELGPLRVQISVNDNSVDIAFRAAHAVTREALEIALPRLKETLAESGLSLTDARVSDQGIADRRQDGSRSGLADFDPSDEDATLAADDLLPERPTQKVPVGLVDTYI